MSETSKMGKSNEAEKDATKQEEFAALLKAAEAGEAGDASLRRRLVDYCRVAVGENFRGRELIFEVYRRSAEAGEVWAMTNLALFYALGYGCERDIEAAQFWRRKFAEACRKEIPPKTDERGDDR